MSNPERWTLRTPDIEQAIGELMLRLANDNTKKYYIDIYPLDPEQLAEGYTYELWEQDNG